MVSSTFGENERDLEGVLRTFGDTARYDVMSPGAGTEAGTEFAYSEQLMKALPDLEIEVQRRHAGDILVEVVIRGTHLGHWRGLPATGRRSRVPTRCVHVRPRRPSGRGKNLRPGHRAETTRRFPRAASLWGQITIWRLIGHVVRALVRNSCVGDAL